MFTESQIFVQQLTNLDFMYFDPVRGLLGQTLIVDVALFGALNDEGMVFDFAHIKNQLKAASNALFDHKLIFPRLLPSATITEKKSCLSIEAVYGEQHYFCHQSPAKAVTMVDAPHITIELLQHALLKHLQAKMPDNVTKMNVVLREESIDGPSFRYGHGLKKHFGDCQRIAHGHRSKLEVCDSQHVRQSEIEKWWCQRWQAIYLATEEDIQQTSTRDGKAYYHMAYRANEGDFALILPAAQCEVLPTDTTIELITQYICHTLSGMHQKSFTVKAYEGLNKGSICARHQ